MFSIKNSSDKKTNLLMLFLTFIFILIIGINLMRPIVDIGASYYGTLQNFSTILISIILETIPFILLGAFISSLIQVFISEQTIAKLIPKNIFVGLFAASLMGFIFPVCECAIIPIARRLLKKGVPTGIVLTFMLAVPIVNPVVLVSTYYAFINKPIMVLLRGGLGLVSAILIGFTVGWLEDGKNPLRKSVVESVEHEHLCSCGHEHEEEDMCNHGHEHEEKRICSCGHEHEDEHVCSCSDEHNDSILCEKHDNKNSIIKSKILEIIEHTSIEFYDIAKYLIFGATISAAFQTFVPRNSLLIVGNDKNLSVIVMIMLAYIISLCSEADAFVARSFMGQFTSGSIVAFMIFGPMLDIKNTLMLRATFKKKFVAELMAIIAFVCFVAGVFVNQWRF